MFGQFILFVLVQISTVLTNKFNDSDYDRMPPLYHLDGFEECFDEPDAIFCYGEFVLISDEPSKLLTMIQEFSDSYRHYNHTLLRHGYCMKKTCNEFYNISGSDVDLRSSFEACSNKTIYNKYKLKTRLMDELDCSKRDRDRPIDNLDIFIGVICTLIIMANLIGSLCDYYLNDGNDQKGLKFLHSFSIFRNWKKFVAPTSVGRDPRLKTLTGIDGIRALNICSVIMSHACFSSIIMLVNPKLVEEFVQVKFFSIFINGSLIMQSFFMISSFMLVYNWLLDLEISPLSWSMLPRRIILRWLRLTPSYALTMGLTVTWFSRLKSGGPAWMKAVFNEVRDCRRDWWAHILYINNYVGRSDCMLHTWYLAADTQLYVFAVIIFFICRTNLTRKVILSLFFVVGIIIPMLHTYYQELRGILMASPDVVLNFFSGDPTFEQVYSKGHTNLSGCIIGMALSYIIYNWQTTGGDPKRFQKYRYVYWCLPFVGALVCFAGYIFIVDGPTLPIYVHVLYAGLQKPIFGLIIATIIAGIIIQFEGLFRAILEWRPFTFIAHLSYSAYLLHTTFIRNQTASLMTVQKFTLIDCAFRILTTVVGVFIAAFFFCLMAEMPFANIVTNVLKRPHIDEQKETKKTEDNNVIDMSQPKTEDGNFIIQLGTRI